MTRHSLVDALRGFALFGVVVSNVLTLCGTGIWAGPASTFDTTTGVGLAYLISGKFLALFSLLFGVSFGLYLRRAAEEGRAVMPPYLRRLLVLFLIGAVHRVVSGTDILMTYALLGAVLLLFRNVSSRMLLLVAVLGLALPEIWSAVTDWLGFRPPRPLISQAERLRLTVEGPYVQLVGMRARMLTHWWIQFLARDTIYLSLFLLGLWTARRGLLEQPERHRGWFRALWWGGLLLTGAGYLAQMALRPMLGAVSTWPGIAFGVVWPATTFVQAITYAAGIVLLWLIGGKFRAALSALSPAGRMALTNYLATSIIVTCVIVLTGRFGRIDPSAALAGGVLLWTVQIWWSIWWLRRHQLGPFEWMWRRAYRAVA